MRWYVLLTRPNHERVVYDRLTERGFQAYLPCIPVWRPIQHGRRQAARPLLPRHVFVRCYLDQLSEVALLCVPGVQRILSEPHGRWLVIPDEAIHALPQMSHDGALPVWAKAWLGATLLDNAPRPPA